MNANVIVLPADAAVELQVLLQSQLRGRVQNLRLLLHEGGLILRGLSRTYYAKQLAQHAAMKASRLRIVANEIEVCSGSAANN
jgi:hypothetical protein